MISTTEQMVMDIEQGLNASVEAMIEQGLDPAALVAIGESFKPNEAHGWIFWLASGAMFARDAGFQITLTAIEEDLGT